MAALATIERHGLGPRLFVLGRRVHEWQAGAFVLAATVALAARGIVEAGALLALLVLGAALVAKDWRDLHPRTRDTAAWRLGLHRVPLPETARELASRVQAAAHIRRLGGGTLDAFALRADVCRRWSTDRRALAAYRVEASTLLVAGEPVGPHDAACTLLSELRSDARRAGLGLGVVGAGEQLAAAAPALGLRQLYLGDEAFIPTGEMPLTGRAVRSLRKAVNRIRRNGYSAEIEAVGALEPATVGELGAVSAAWLAGSPERGFSMAHDRLVDELLPDALVVLARDGTGRVRGFLQFLPVTGRPVVSLAAMRGDRETPNGLMDFLVVEAARLLAQRGIRELSLNFSAFGRWLRDPATAWEALLARVLRIGDRWFQVERLLRFNAKFHPRWEPRYLLYDRARRLPRVALAAMWAEGQLPRLGLRRQRTAAAAHELPAPAAAAPHHELPAPAAAAP